MQISSGDLLLLSLLLSSLHAISPSRTIDDQLLISQNHQNVYNVDDFGAKGDRTDDREAFMKAWKEACYSHFPAFFLVPEKKTYLLKPVSFYGPCNSIVTVMIMGTVEASSNESDWDNDDNSGIHWILFSNITDLNIQGGGTIIGNGEIWWKDSCKVNTNLPCRVAPTALTFFACNKLRVENLNIKNSQQIHISVEECIDVSISNVMIAAPEKSPNTDGIHVSNTNNMVIKDCVIKTGDDCISIATGSQNVRVMNIVCGPGHGISIGSLGANNSVASVSEVIVDNVTLSGTTNGVRIKTWQGGQGHARNITFQNIIMQNVYNPIIIDQNYCDSLNPCHEQNSAVSISHVIYKNIKGTSASKVAVNLSCSKTLPCQEIEMEDIKLVGEGGKSTESLCSHVVLAESEMVFPPLCV
ncbi:polygalacturonase-like [Phalaenopsis equestris]|uniref:polygalacturonase-like n=1 Tax=Phalaenopsis equestris TaxID=78828 RepID=UPI0009E4A8E0|nr:polygalacturonase-like [Phalaenopsis equestris]